MNFFFLPEAESEFLESIDFLEDREEGLGVDFARKVFATIQRIIAHQDSWPLYVRDCRRCLTRRFPFAVVYRVDNNELIIWAVAHSSREPGYWSKRVN